MLEDDFTYVLRKALRGHDLSPAEAAGRAGLPETEVLAFSRGRFSSRVARALAPVLGLDAEAFSTHPDYLPTPLAVEGITRLVLPFGEDHVNAWLVEKEGTRLLFDTGDDDFSCLSALESRGHRELDSILITHGHPDHIAGLASVKPLAAAAHAHGPGIPGALPLEPDMELAFGPLTVRTRDLSGHFTPAAGYLISGLEQPVLVPGDALFAGSIGGCPSPSVYRHALERIRAVLATLPDETLILPGHGPATTLGEERARNPFPIR